MHRYSPLPVYRVAGLVCFVTAGYGPSPRVFCGEYQVLYVDIGKGMVHALDSLAQALRGDSLRCDVHSISTTESKIKRKKGHSRLATPPAKSVYMFSSI